MDYSAYIEQLHVDLLAVVNAQHAMLVLLSAFLLYMVFYRREK